MIDQRAPAPGDQPPPSPNTEPSVHVLVGLHLGQMPQDNLLRWITYDLRERATVGLERYGTVLQAGNGRDARWDGYQEALDGLAYAGQLVAETVADTGEPVVTDGVAAAFEAQLAACRAWAALVHPAATEEGA